LSEARQQLGTDGTADLQRALALDPASPAVNALAAVSWQRRGDYAQALAYLDAAQRAEPRNPAWQAEIAHTLALQGDLLAAQAAYLQAIDLAPGDALYWRLLAQFALQYQGQPRSVALPAARQAVLLAPRDPATLVCMAQTLLQLGDTRTAERYLQNALALAPADPSVHLHLGHMYLLRGEAAAANREFQQVQELAPGAPLAEQARRMQSGP